MNKFDALWKNFPDKAKINKICTNKQKTSNAPFDNYCAILLSECFIRSGIDLSLIEGDRCWSHPGKNT